MAENEWHKWVEISLLNSSYTAKIAIFKRRYIFQSIILGMHVSSRRCIAPFQTGSRTAFGPKIVEVSRYGTGSFRGELRQTLRGQYLTSCAHRHGTCPGHSGGRVGTVWEIGGLGVVRWLVRGGPKNHLHSGKLT